MVSSGKDVALIAGLGILALVISKAGKDLFGALPALDEGLRKSIGDIQSSIGDFKFPSINIGGTTIGETVIESTFPNIPESDKDILQAIQDQGGLQGQTNQAILDLLSGLTELGTPENPADAPVTPTPIDVILNDPTLTEQQKKDLLNILGDVTPTTDSGAIVAPEDIGKCPCGATTETQFGITFSTCKTCTETIQPSSTDSIIQQQDIIPTPEPSVESLLPTEQQFEAFAAEGSTATQFTIQENPIDTLSEVLDAFPQLTASQASDFLSEFSGILPSELSLVDPDIKNIVASVEGETVQVSNVSISDLEAEEEKALEIFDSSSISNF